VLDRLVSDAAAGSSRVLVLRGGPGVGRSTLLAHLAGRLGGWRVVRAAGVESEAELPHSGLHQVCAPLLEHLRDLPPPQAEALGAEIFHRIEPALEGADVVMMLRLQRERLSSALLPSLREFSRTFGLSPRRLELAKPDAIVMHPGPMNRGVEIDPAIADGARSVILDQVEAGVAVRMAVLWMLAAEAVEAIPA